MERSHREVRMIRTTHIKEFRLVGKGCNRHRKPSIAQCIRPNRLTIIAIRAGKAHNNRIGDLVDATLDDDTVIRHILAGDKAT